MFQAHECRRVKVRLRGSYHFICPLCYTNDDYNDSDKNSRPVTKGSWGPKNPVNYERQTAVQTCNSLFRSGFLIDGILRDVMTSELK